MIDAETGLRGFLLTGQESYHRGRRAFSGELAAARRLSAGHPTLAAMVEREQRAAYRWVYEVASPAIAARRKGKSAAAVAAGGARAKEVFDAFRTANGAAGITRPLARLADALIGLRAGRLGRVAVEGPPEVQAVAAALNALVGENRALTAEQEERLERERRIRTVRELRRREGLDHLPAVFLSARVLPDDIEAGRRLGAAYLTKPFVASALFSAIDNLLPEQDAGGW